MAQRLQIQCINKLDRSNIHERIQNVGGLNWNRTRWKLSLADAITGIKIGKYQFYVIINNREVEVVIATSQHGYPYLKTEPDDHYANNLLSLPECP